MFGWRKENIVTKMIEEYLQECEECQGLFRNSFQTYMEKSLCQEFNTLVSNTSAAESSCDDIRRKIEASMYEKALIPESRGDILRLLENIVECASGLEDR